MCHRNVCCFSFVRNFPATKVRPQYVKSLNVFVLYHVAPRVPPLVASSLPSMSMSSGGVPMVPVGLHDGLLRVGAFRQVSKLFPR
jgi:hypothetical protein